MTVKNYLMTLLTVAAVTAVASCLTAEGKTKKYVHFILALVIMLVVTAPLGSLIWEVGEVEFPPYTETTPSGGDAILRATEVAVKDVLCREFSLKQTEVQVTVDGEVTETGGVTMRAVTVTLFGESQSAREQIWLYLNTQVTAGCDIRVAIAEEGV